MYKSAKFGLVLTVTYLQIYIHFLTVTLLNNSVELSSNLDPEPLNEWNWNSAAHPIFELLSGLNWLGRWSANQ